MNESGNDEGSRPVSEYDEAMECAVCGHAMRDHDATTGECPSPARNALNEKAAEAIRGVMPSPRIADALSRLRVEGGHPNPPRLIVVCGGRDYRDRERIRSVLAEYLPANLRTDEPTILHGCAKGADTIAGEEATDLGFWVEGVEANWAEHGKAAGPIRNRELLDRNPDLVIAFPGGKGTADMVRESRRRGIEVRVVAERSDALNNPVFGWVRAR